MEPIADVYLLPPNAGRSVSFRTTPGAKLDFLGGHARVFDPRQIPWLLQRDDVNLVPTPRYAELAPRWCAALPEHLPVRAQITLPYGWWLDKEHKLHTEPRYRETCLGCDAPLTIPYVHDVRFCTRGCRTRYDQARSRLAETQPVPDWGVPDPEPAPVGG